MLNYEMAKITEAMKILEKAERIAHYMSREPVEFIQLDAFVHDTGKNDIDLFKVRTCELMSGAPAVRVLVTENTERSDVIRVLKTMLEFIQEDEDFMLIKEPKQGVDLPF